jgi:hypothetical protein
MHETIQTAAHWSPGRLVESHYTSAAAKLGWRRRMRPQAATEPLQAAHSKRAAPKTVVQPSLLPDRFSFDTSKG